MTKKQIKNKEIVLAYSGGLDTSFCIPYLIEQGFTIHAVSINTGGFKKAELADMRKRAFALGAKKYKSIDISKAYYKQCVRYLLFGNILRNDTYPLSVSSERAFQALAVLKYVQEVGAKYVAHGSTGAGNDQIRFDIIFESLAPDVTIITPIRDNSLSRAAEVAYLKKHGFKWSSKKKDYSINQGIWGTSVGGKETLTSHLGLPESAYPSQLKLKKLKEISITFKKGEPTHLSGKRYNNPIDLINKLNDIASAYAIGRDVHVGDTIIGIKGRVGFEAAAALILIKAHHLLEKHTLSKWQSHWKKQLADWYGMLLHEGQYLEPSMRNIEQFLEDTQKYVTGKVTIKLKPYSFELVGIESKHDLMNSTFGSYGEANLAWTGDDAKGFTKILSNQHKIFYAVNKEKLDL